MNDFILYYCQKLGQSTEDEVVRDFFKKSIEILDKGLENIEKKHPSLFACPCDTCNKCERNPKVKEKEPKFVVFHPRISG